MGARDKKPSTKKKLFNGLLEVRDKEESKMVKLVEYLSNFKESHDAAINHSSMTDNNGGRIRF